MNDLINELEVRLGRQLNDNEKSTLILYSNNIKALLANLTTEAYFNGVKDGLEVVKASAEKKRLLNH